MRSYFFNREEGKNVLYVPLNLIVTEEKEGLDIDYKVNNIKAFDFLWRTDRKKLLGKDLSNCLIDYIDIPDGILKKFQDYCFGNENKDIIHAHIFSGMIFYEIKKEVENFRKRKCQ